MNKIVTISRQFGSGGREVGKRLADALQCAYYDKELLSELAQQTGLSADFIEKFDEKATRNYSFTFSRSFASYVQTPMEKLQVEQLKLLKSLAQKGDAVFIGRCADSILCEVSPFKVFIYSGDMGARIKRCLDNAPEGSSPIDAAEMEKTILSIDKNRKKYYEHQTGKKWLEMSNYNLCIDTARVGIKGAVALILSALEQQGH